MTEQQRLDNLTSEELMILYQAGDHRAFEKLYLQTAPKIFGYLRSKLRNSAAAEDALQLTFLKLHSSRGLYDAKFKFMPWLFTISRSVLLDQLRKEKKHRVDVNIENADKSAMEDIEGDEISLVELPPHQRDAVNLRFKEELSFEEIAKRLKTSPVNVRQLISRAIKVLRGKNHGK